MALKLAISQRIVSNSSYYELRDALSHDWPDFISRCFSNQIVLIPVFNNPDIIKPYLNSIDIDGIVLSGGNDLDEYKERDVTEYRMIDFALENSTPVLGICRGMQIINKYFGGKVTQGISKVCSSSHIAVEHTVHLIDNELIKYTESALTVNSYHNDGVHIEGLSDKLRPFAVADNAVVEGLYSSQNRIAGIQWHPERLALGRSTDFDVKLFQKIFDIQE